MIKQIFKIHRGCYGYRRIKAELRKRGYGLNHKTVQKLMRQLQLKCCVRLKRYRAYQGSVGKIAPNRLNRHFNASQPNVKWVTDVTEFKLGQHKLYLSAILDLYNREIISYQLSPLARFDLVKQMLGKGLYGCATQIKSCCTPIKVGNTKRVFIKIC